MPAESRMGARTLGALHLAMPGALVYSNPERLRRVDDAIGGVLIEIVDTPTIDRETGEVTHRRAFRCWDHLHSNGPGRPAGGYVTVAEDDCGPDSIEGVDHSLVTAVTAQMARQYLDRRGKTGRRMLVGYDADLLHHGSLLAKVLMGV